jgi:23S rRNA pseudouridine1911/1915/1917 synthase
MTIVFEDNHLLIVNKACGELVQVDQSGDASLEDRLKDWLKQTYNKPGNVFLGVAHRLDRPVTGLVIFAKTSKALTRLNEMFKSGSIHKTYLAVVKQAPPNQEGLLEHHLFRIEKQNKSVACNAEKPGSKKAALQYKVIGKSDTFYLLEINLLTGRHHQIRCQLAAIGCPIKGDLKYGYPRSNPDGGISLHSWKVRFNHPVGGQLVQVDAPLPDNDQAWVYFKNIVRNERNM